MLLKEFCTQCHGLDVKYPTQYSNSWIPGSTTVFERLYNLQEVGHGELFCFLKKWSCNKLCHKILQACVDPSHNAFYNTIHCIFLYGKTKQIFPQLCYCYQEFCQKQGKVTSLQKTVMPLRERKRDNTKKKSSLNPKI